MQRTSLVLSVAMSVSDLLLHVSVCFTVINDENEDDARNALAIPSLSNLGDYSHRGRRCLFWFHREIVIVLLNG